MRFCTWPTFVVIVCDYSLLFVLTFYWAAIPWPILLILAGIVAAWYSSLEHEILHGHPTKWGLSLAWLRQHRPRLCLVRAYALRAKEPVRHPVCDASERL